MRRLSGVVLAGVMLLVPAFAPSALAQAAQQKFTLEGDLALWSVAIKPDKTADYEQVLTKLKDALGKAAAPEAKQQLAGWKVMKAKNPLPDGRIIYTHVINPVAGADYNVLQVIYATVTDPTEQKSVYDLYSGAFGGNLGVNFGTIVADFSK